MTIYEDKVAALDWISSIESERGQIRDVDTYPAIANWVRETSPTKILDLGCGQGICSAKIDLTGRRYYGLDCSTFMVERAKKMYPHENREFFVGNAYTLPFAASTFDGVFSVALWHLLENVPKASKELSRVIRPGGGFLIITANPGAFSLWKDFYLDPKTQGPRIEGSVVRADNSMSREVIYLYPENEIMDELQRVGLETQMTKTFRTSEKSNGIGYYLQIQGYKVK